MKSFDITVGRLYIRAVRDYLNRLKFEHHNIDFYESSGWLSHDFVIKGGDRIVQFAASELNEWMLALEEKKATR